ncbi:hypothetical protein FHY55_14835 [Oceanicola sp. D3]|uniref:sensor histidine kinase n=1 Tax=Oceanicola sp. D3 TaxID=2587163 RepID=UPI00111F3747|nr:histidine kinase dimerization/phosphoacceptor domain -containing protein [Oceanicola sp. D3]QDC10440.1 hypothetical protein FHY55_14835 [Oceanicola sp. D3]
MFDTSDIFGAIEALTDDGFCLCEMLVDADGAPVDYRFLRVNGNFEAMTGLKDATGRTALEMVPELEFQWIETYARAGLGGEKLGFVEGSVAMGRVFEVNAAPAEAPGQFYILFRDVTARETAQAEREAALDQSRRLLAELSHRVKNNLAVISSVLRMEARGSSEETSDALARARGRLEAVAGLYALLESAGTIETVAAEDYLPKLVAMLQDSLGVAGRLEIVGHAEAMRLPSRSAIQLGLIVNETVTNAIKHAFPGGASGEVRVRLHEAEGQRRLVVADTGRGMVAESEGHKGLGRALTEAFVRDLEGEMQVESGPEGTTVTILF